MLSETDAAERGGHVDSRTPITMWELLIWAYKRQMVHYEGCGPDGPQMRSQGVMFASLASIGWFDSMAAGDSWSINAKGTTAHADAYLVHDRVMLLKPAEGELVMRTAIKGKSPEWNPELEPCAVVPVYRGGTGRIEMIYPPKGKKPIGCKVRCLGIPPSEARQIRMAARETYELWWRLLRRLRLSLSVKGGLGSGLSRWRITGIGAIREPWCGPDPI